MTQSATKIAQTRAMLASLSITRLSVSKMDKRATAKVLVDSGAQGNVAKVSKNLLPDCTEMKAITKHDNAIRAFFYTNTLPWSDNSTRLLPSRCYKRVTKRLSEMKRDREILIENFISAYVQSRDASKAQLAGLYDPNDYPSESEVRERFSINIEFYPLPDAGDFRLSIAEDEIKAIQTAAEQQIQSNVAEASREVIERAFEAVSHMADKLANYEPPKPKEGKKAKSVFRDSLVSNIQELAELLPDLNVTGDPKINQLADKLHKELCEHSPDDLRRDERLREQVADKAKATRDTVAEWLA